MGFAYAVKEALSRVDTPYVMVVQHDFAFVRPFNLQAVLTAMTAQPEVLK
jgi:GTP:adenosylcobinamide-phosphate guanylyltransferase